ncbi:MAG: Gfo/Idh/MocA family oxidoreductase [Promicromonosporaceae bacterium]|nr:Gfo/Idh/MocA family oxidoreductase [Promicromonosporaceae bacterium]
MADQNPTAPRPSSAQSGVADPSIMPVFKPVPADRPRRRYAVVGLGHRAGMYVDAIVHDQQDVAELVAWCDSNPTRMDYYDAQVGEALGLGGPAGLPEYAPADLEKMIAEQNVDVVIITTPDSTHAELIARAQAAGADVVVEKPLTTTAEGIKLIGESVGATGRDIVMTFNYRYSPRNSTLREVIQSGEIGDVTSVHFEWVLDTVHGADYFRRWHRQQRNSGSLLIHKAAHHFDLVDFWLNDYATRVYASAGLKFYGAKNAATRGLGERPVRGTGLEGTKFERDPWAFDLRKDPRLKALYLDAEHHDGYLRDRDVFNEPEGSEIDIYDNMALIVDYAKGATLTYSLNAHAPWEGYTVYVNGTKGRAELTVVERGAVVIDADGNVVLDPSANPEGVKGGHLLAEKANFTEEQKARIAQDIAHPVRPELERLVVQKHWETAREWPIPAGSGGHGGGDAIMLSEVFRGDLRIGDDPLGRAAGYLDGVRAVAVGIAANESLKTGQAVDIAEDLGIDLRDS